MNGQSDEVEMIETHPLIEYFEKTQKMGITPILKPFGKGYRLEVGNIHVYFENKQMTYTGWGMVFNEPTEGIAESKNENTN